ncbi:MAG TPA: 4-vinyl reductase [Anaerolineales bacterium]
MLGENGLNAALRSVGLERFAGNFPPNDTNPGIKTVFLDKTELVVVHRLPVPARRRCVLDLVAGRFRDSGGAASVHTLDLDLMLVDHSAAAACGQSSDEPICYVTLGIIQGALFWAIGQEADVEEVGCKATGAQACEFKVKLGGK